jgi:ABC-2 type transport system permease protein
LKVPMLNSSRYEHWQGQHLGIWHRRGVIAANGLRSCLQIKWMRRLLTLCWAASLFQVVLLFALGQLLVKDSVIVQWLGTLNPQIQQFAGAFIGWLEQHPHVSIRTTYDLIFFYFSHNLTVFTLIAIGLTIPHLITRDLSSHAIVVYSSKAINRFDYLLGKFGTLLGVMCLTWLGPVLAAWLLGNLLSPNWHFFWHSRLALAHSVTFISCSMVLLGVLALGVSAMSSQPKVTVGAWVALWLLGQALVPIAKHTEPWLKFASFKYDLQQLALTVFRLKDDFDLAQQNMPLFGDLLAEMRRKSATALENPEMTGAAMALGIMVVLATAVLLRRAKPE